MSPRHPLFEEVAAYEDRLVDSMDVADQARELLVEAATAGRATGRPRTYRRWIAAAAAVLVAGAGAGWLLADRGPSPTRPAVQWLHAQGDAAQDLRFSDGSVSFAAGARGRVAKLGPHRRKVIIEKGTATLRVRHHADTSWQVVAGPFAVQVVGTAFTVHWDPEAAYLAVRVTEGTVAVSGPLLDHPHPLESGAKLEVSLMDQRLTLTRDTDDTTTGQALRARQDTADGAPRASREPRHRRATPPPNPKEILRLANEARTRGDTRTAAAMYKRLRSLYGGSPVAATAALYLGRMAFDQQRDFAAAASWLTTYLQESAHGPLHREAMGLLMEAQRRTGDLSAARRTAAAYLQRYPDGPHARRARSLLDK